MTTGSRVIAVTSLDTEQRLDALAPAGSTIGEIVEFALPGATPDVMPWVRVTIGNDLIPRELWEVIRPKPQTVVVVRVLPGNSGVIRSVLSIAVAVAAIALGQYYAVPLAGAAGFAGSSAAASVAGSLITATTLLAGTFLINALVPIRNDQASSGGGPSASPTYSVQGFRNVANPDGVVPCVMGKIRFAPPYAALPYTENENGEVYVRALFLLGYGPLAIRDIKIGDTPIDAYKEITYEVLQGYPSDLPQSIYPRQVLEERMSVDLNQVYATANGPHTRFTAADADECQIDVSFPNGLFHMISGFNGTITQTFPNPMSVVIRVEYRLNGTGGWTNLLDWNITAFSQKPIAFSHRWQFPARGRYEIRLTRLTPDYDDLNGFDQNNQYVSVSYWSSIRSFRPEYPLNFNHPLALIAVRVKSSKQLNGVLDNLNCEASRICLDWNGSAWVEQETQNPASLYRYALQGPAAAYPRTDAEIDLAQIQEWHGWCAGGSLAYNRVQDYEASIFDVMGDIAAAGQAAPRDDGTKWGVVIDRKQTVTIAHMTPRNSWNFSGERPYVIFPHAFRVKFYDQSNFYKPAERVVPWPGFVGTPSIMESIEFPGVTNPDLIWLEARKRQYELIYRRDVFYIMQDFEGSIARRGDMVLLAHDILKSTLLAARVKMVAGNTVTLDDFVTMETGGSYVLRIRKLGTGDNAPDDTVLRTVQTVPGRSNTILLTGAGAAPAVDDLVVFGESGLETEECIVREVEGAEDFARRFVLIPHAPEMFDLLAAEVPPAWNGRVGGDLTPSIPAIAPADLSQFFVTGFF